MRVSAYWGTAVVHFAAIALATLPADPRSTWNVRGGGSVADGGGSGVNDGAHSDGQGAAPRIFLLADLTLPDGIEDVALHVSELCPRTLDLDRGAIPLFPVAGERSPFAQLSPVGENDEWCVRIEADGRVSAAFATGDAGQARIDVVVRDAVRSLRFAPAQRNGRAVAAWHRLIISRPAGAGSLPAIGPDVVPTDLPGGL